MAQSKIGEFRARDKIPFYKKIMVDLGPEVRTFKQPALSINSSSITLQVAMTDAIFDRLSDIYSGAFTVFLVNKNYFGRKKAVLHHTRRFRAILTKWIFSFTDSLSSHTIRKIRDETPSN